MKKSLNDIINNFQMVLYIVFVFLWFISSKIHWLRIVAIIIFATFSAIQLLKILKRRNLFTNKSVFLYFLFLLWSFISVIWAQNAESVINKTFDLICNTVFMVLTYDYFYELKISTKKFLAIFITIGVVFAIYVLMYYGPVNYFTLLTSGRRVGGDIINVNFIGLVCTMTFLIIIFSVISGLYKNKLVLLPSLIALIVSLGTGSKKVFLGLGVGLLLIFIYYIKGKITLKKIRNVLLIILITFVAFDFIKESPYFSRIFARTDEMFNTLIKQDDYDGSTYERGLYIKEGLKTFSEYPITGIGLNNASIITNRVSGKETYLHCNYVELLACTGIIGFALYYFIYCNNAIKCIKQGRNNKLMSFALILMIVMLALEVGSVTYYEIKTAMYFILIFILVDKQNWIGDNTCEN